MQVWMREGVTEANLRQNIAAFHRQEGLKGTVSLVLGAGNVAATSHSTSSTGRSTAARS